MGTDKWIYIDDFKNELPAKEYYHCDTRDFHIYPTEGEPAEVGLRSLVYGADPQDYIKRQDILPYLKAIEEASGGKNPWRHLRFEGKDIPKIWWKYIRFKKVPHTEDLYFVYTTTGKQHIPMSPRTHNADAVVEEYKY